MFLSLSAATAGKVELNALYSSLSTRSKKTQTEPTVITFVWIKSGKMDIDLCENFTATRMFQSLVVVDGTQRRMTAAIRDGRGNDLPKRSASLTIFKVHGVLLGPTEEEQDIQKCPKSFTSLPPVPLYSSFTAYIHIL